MPQSPGNMTNASPQLASTTISVLDISLDTSGKLATRDTKTVKLTKKETALLQCLLENKNKILTRKQLLKKVWNAPSDIHTRTLDVYIGYLRKKIDTGFPVKRIYSIRGLGYILKTD